jgi:8-oxo-dGTP pyrophosphatase MutT (NUDIX family)
VPLTAEGRVVLVRLSYAKGWHLPGGGRKRGEEPEQAVLRELREEIGLTAHSELLRVGEFAHRPDYRRGTTTLFLLRDVRFSPRPSLEIEEIAVFDPAQLPDRVTALTGSKIAEALAESSAR